MTRKGSPSATNRGVVGIIKFGLNQRERYGFVADLSSERCGKVGIVEFGLYELTKNLHAVREWDTKNGRLL